MQNQFLPIGSICTLVNNNKKVMIIGYNPQTYNGTIRSADYLGCTYPEGFLLPSMMTTFMESEISKVDFMGYPADVFAGSTSAEVVIGQPFRTPVFSNSSENEGELLFKNGNNYSLRTPQYGYTINNNNRIAYALDNEIIIGDDGNTIINGAKQAMQRAQDLKTASAMQLDKELASQGIKLIGREENSTYSLLDDIIVEVNGTVKRLETKAYFSDITMYKEALLEWIKNGNSYVFKGELY